MQSKKLVLAVAMLASASFAQLSLQTTFAGGNGQNGNMFDIVAISPITVTTLDCSIAAGVSTNIAVYTHTGTVGATTGTAGAWTLIGNANVVSAGTNVPTPIPLPLNVTIAAGATQAFYVTCTNGSIVAYTNGTAVGNTLAQNADLRVLEGYGVVYPFAGTFSPRNYNGIIHYQLGSATPLYQVNQTGASLDINGVNGNAYSPASVTQCANLNVTVNAASTSVGNPWDAVISFSPLLTSVGGGIVTPNGQIVNVNLATAVFLNGGTLTSPFYPFSLPVSFPAATDIYFQMFVIDPLNPEGFSLSAANTLHVVVGSGLVAGPTGDDAGLAVPLLGAPLCAAPIVFYGTSNTQIFVQTNGRVTFGSSDTTFGPTTAGAMTGGGSVGAWADLNTATAGNITITSSGTTVSVNYNGVGFFGGTAATVNTYQIQFDTSTGTVALTGLAGLPIYTATQMIGIARGLGATDPGARTWAIGGPNVMAQPTDMIYTLTTAGAALTGTGIGTILFTPDPVLGGYQWTAF